MVTYARQCNGSVEFLSGYLFSDIDLFGYTEVGTGRLLSSRARERVEYLEFAHETHDSSRR